ncbi:hypothetical protein GGX14DRAFT_407446 [Mycena pura]|uniref:Uncharacterized protein n=1 Tax=Mycena pura TaxID=153505 RepID=A0AAD6UVA6_9AGAR|nr:hypothetical protein GGX14DRAFT_407446 [Mycena pura]
MGINVSLIVISPTLFTEEGSVIVKRTTVRQTHSLSRELTYLQNHLIRPHRSRPGRCAARHGGCMVLMSVCQITECTQAMALGCGVGVMSGCYKIAARSQCTPRGSRGVSRRGPHPYPPITRARAAGTGTRRLARVTGCPAPRPQETGPDIGTIHIRFALVKPFS